jgi:hypothetical protein
MNEPLFDRFLAFVQRLEQAKIAYFIKHSRPTALTVTIDIPGERWEVDFLDDGSVDVERFVSNGKIYDEPILEELFTENGATNTKAEEAVNDESAARK